MVEDNGLSEDNEDQDRTNHPYTPPNTIDDPINVPQSTRRESSRIPQTSTKSKKKNVADSTDKEVRAAGVKQTSRLTGQVINVDTIQDLDDENRRAPGKKKVPDKDKDGYDHCKLYFHPPGLGPKQDSEAISWACRWCNKEYVASGGSYYNLKAHRDGANIKGSIRLACKGWAKAIKAGGHFPPSVSKLAVQQAQENQSSAGTLLAYATKGKFDNNTLNKLIVAWIIQQSLPWIRIEDFHLRVAFNHALHNSQLHSWIWAATQARQLYLELRTQESNSKISLVSDVWTTKRSHKVFVGIGVCYINQQWKFFHSLSLTSNQIYYILAQTTDSGSNNFTMAKGVAAIFREFDGTRWDVENNHHQCVCHVLALILGAGLKALKLSTNTVRPKKDDHPFPVLSPIIEVDEPEDTSNLEIFKVHNKVELHEEWVEPEDAEKGTPQARWVWDDDEEDPGNETGIVFTLKKIDYICHQIALSPQKRAEWKLWASKLGYKGRGLIAGYGICWNIAFDSQQQAYKGRKVIKQLLENEDEMHAGKLPAGHFFRSYSLNANEWEEVNNLNSVFKEFLELTKQMEGDYAKLAMVLYEYVQLEDFLNKQKHAAAAANTSLWPMFEPMLKITKKYLNLALNCDTIILATFLHPAWRMMLFNKRFEVHITRITELIQETFEEREFHLKSLEPISPPKDSRSDPNGSPTNVDSESNGDKFNFYPENPQAIQMNTKIKRYTNGNFPMDKKGCALAWWKVRLIFYSMPIIWSLANLKFNTHYIDSLQGLSRFGILGP
ncbi:hypothetical protein PTTG_25078 [Puccinia triticina 1-1 BBBD Race 1]|uniref:HAT C-terminal dimerisation domain-containing protein n=1 Tax=Puccinia triticina (isolate 1-1 / race 1 (BBBD)) TaxID=630390 RepID=A0A180H4F5_PUCT1|nr:hypothetical protein PTTG_25078 [Puccinia triticina 1-1 BBBD Race 1]